MLSLLLLALTTYSNMIEPLPNHLIPIVKRSAEKHNLNPALVLAVIKTESKGHKWASRYEAGFYRKYLSKKPLSALPGKNPSDVDVTQELEARATSFGVMQLMLQTARELGFAGYDYELFNYETNIDLGCKYLALKLKKSNGVVRNGLLGYNGGGDPKYPDRVFKNLDWVNTYLSLQDRG